MLQPTDNPLEGLMSAVNILQPAFSPYGFTFSVEYVASASAGPFANGFFKGDYFRVGIIYRKFDGLGSASYENENGVGGHDDIMITLGHGEDYHFRFDDGSWRVYSTTGSKPVDALLYDLTHFATKLFEGNKAEVDSIIDSAIIMKISKLM